MNKKIRNKDNNYSDNKIVFGVVIYNEEKTIERCLKSIVFSKNINKKLQIKIIVVHDGPCTDKSLAIARKYTHYVYVRKRIGCCEGHFDFLKKKSKNSWLFLIDGDEYLSSELKKNLPNLLEDSNVDAYEIYWPTYYNGRILKLGLDRRFYKKVLFRSNKVIFELYPHGKRLVIGTVKKCEYPLIHKPVCDPFSKEYLDKKMKWSIFAADIIYKNIVYKSSLFYLCKAFFIWVFYILYFSFVRLYFLSGRIGFRYTLFFAKYNFLINYFLFKKTLK
ncbi:MAG: glycosyltransferase [Candidatus Woesearchaeota archaeon]